LDIEILNNPPNNSQNKTLAPSQPQIQEDNTVERNPRIITRSMTASINSSTIGIQDNNNNNKDNNKELVVEIPRKEDQYYKQFEKIHHCAQIIDKYPDIFLIKEGNNEPNSYNQAITGPHANNWSKAMKLEISELVDKNTWDIVDIPKDRQPLGARWVYRLKTDQNNNIIKYKARWVVQGFKQIEGLDYLETFSTVCRPETYRITFVLATALGWTLHQFDVKNAFVHADIDTDIYVTLPQGFYNDLDKNKKCLKLKKALYGLKQSPRLWYKYLSNILNKLGFKAIPYDEGAFINHHYKMILLCHVDDLIITGPNHKQIKEISEKISTDIELKYIGEVNTFLGIQMKINKKNKTLLLHQEKYTKNIIKKYNKEELPLRKSPTRNIKLYKNNGQATYKETVEYQRYVGSILYLAVKTRPDIAYPIQRCAKYASNPAKEHFLAVDDIFAYLHNCPEEGILYNCSNIKELILKIYCDSDWASCLDTRRSVTGYITMLANNTISWNSTLQKTVATSTTEAEYMALADACKEALYICNSFNYITKELSIPVPKQLPLILVDNTGAIKLANNPEFHKRTKHIDIRYHFVRELLENNEIQIKYIPSKENLADSLTKTIPITQLEQWKKNIQLV
jgi:hypothetical protein